MSFRSSSGPGRLRCSITLSGELPELVLGPVARQLTELGGRSRHCRDGPLPLVGHELRRRHGPPVQCPTPWSDLGGDKTQPTLDPHRSPRSAALQVEIGKRVRVSPSRAAHPRSASAGEESLSVALGQGQTDQPWRHERGGPDPFSSRDSSSTRRIYQREPSRPEGAEVVVAVAIQNGSGRY
jgi:hypothetical protein